ncbi:MAG: putative Ig domain-containing protein [Acidimicrobiia bacterium]|nr:putative Ig domain-containing protein [Acidimicrobiia bacterium]
MIAVRRRAAIVSAILLLGVAAVAPASAGSGETVRDEFDSIAFDGNNGSVAWSDDWRELPFGDGPATGQIQVVTGSRCAATNCLRLGDQVLAAGIAREADMAGHTSAALAFTYRRDLVDGDGDRNGKIKLRVGTSVWSWTTLATYPLTTSDSSPVMETFDISDYAGAPVYVGFFGEGYLDGHFYVDDVQITMSSNRDPFFEESMPDRHDAEGDWISITPEVSDPDYDALSFAASGLPQGVSINTDTGTISGVLGRGAAQSSPYATVVTASDGLGGQDAESFTWTVSDVNRPPELDPISDAAIGEGSLLSISTEAIDPDLPFDSLGYVLTAAPTGATIDSRGKLTWTPAESHGPGSYNFSVRVMDSGDPALSVTRSFAVTVTEVNRPPTLSAIPDQANGAGDRVALSVNAVDPDVPGNSLSYSATGLPPGVSISESSGVISGIIAGSAAPSNNTVTVTVVDDGAPGLQAMQTFSWQVTEGNHAPVLNPIPDQQPGTSGVVSFTAAATDADSGDSVTFWLADGIDPVPSGASIDAKTGEFSWSPADDQHEATYRINIGVSDSGSPRLSDTQLVTITVPKLNQAPTIVNPGDQRSAEGDVVSLQIEAQDDNNLRYRAIGLPTGLSVDPATGLVTGTIDYESGGGSPYSVTVEATDDGAPAKTGSTSFVWTVAETNRPPQVDEITVVVLVGQPKQILLTADDPDGDTLAFEVVAGPQAGSLQGEGPAFVYTSPGGAESDYILVLVSDGELETEAEVAIQIRASNFAPTADGDSYDLAEGESLRVEAPGVLGNDSDLDADPLVAELVSPPAHGHLELNEDGSFSYVPDAGFAGGDKFIYSAVDVLGEESSATVILNVATIEAAIPPPIDDGPRDAIVAATDLLWLPPPANDGSFIEGIPRAIVAALNQGITTLPAMRYTLLLLAIALLLGLTFGRISVLPTGAGKHQEDGWVQSYDQPYAIGRIVPDDGEAEVFVTGRALEKTDELATGQRVRFVAATIRGRRIALKVWPVAD